MGQLASDGNEMARAAEARQLGIHLCGHDIEGVSIAGQVCEFLGCVFTCVLVLCARQAFCVMASGRWGSTCVAMTLRGCLSLARCVCVLCVSMGVRVCV